MTPPRESRSARHARLQAAMMAALAMGGVHGPDLPTRRRLIRMGALARPESTRERVRHAARRDGLLLHQVLASPELVARYGAEALVA